MITEAQTLRLCDIAMQIVAGNMSTGKGRETLRNEGFPVAVWSRFLAPLADPATDTFPAGHPARGLLDLFSDQQLIDELGARGVRITVTPSAIVI
jgi:hypothetical protein